MKIKIWNFNFLSEGENELDFVEYKLNNRFDRFYMDGKEDTLFVKDSSKFDDVDKWDYKYEKELLEKYYIIDYHLLIRNKINSFIKQKAMELYTNNNYSRYELYNLIKFDDLNKLEHNAKSQFWYNEKITKENKIVYEIEGGYNLIFDPYTEEIENIETLYEQKLFSNEIKNNLILLEIERNKAPEFIKHILEISKFLEDKKTVNLLFENGDIVKINASIGNIFDLWNNEISLDCGIDKYGIKELKKILFNRKELNIDINKLSNLEEQIIKTPAEITKNDESKVQKNLLCWRVKECNMMKARRCNTMKKVPKEISNGIYEVIPLHKVREKNGDVWTEYMHINVNNGTIIYDITLGHCLPTPEIFNFSKFQELIYKNGIDNINGAKEFINFINKYPEIYMKGIKNENKYGAEYEEFEV